MEVSKFKHKHVFCIEGDWTYNVKDTTTINAGLKFLKSNADIQYIRKYCSSKNEFNDLLAQSLKQAYQEFGIIYLAFHGSSGELHINNTKRINFENIVRQLNGEAKDKIIHFGSCKTLDIPGWDLRRFKKETGAIAVSGYTKEISFIESTVLDILYFIKCQGHRKIPLIHRDMLQYHSQFMKRLGFKMVYDK